MFSVGKSCITTAKAEAEAAKRPHLQARVDQRARSNQYPVPVSLHQEVQGCIRESSGSPSEWKYFRTSKEGVMNVLPVALVIFAVVVLAGVLWFGLATLLQIRARRQRLQMKRHLQSIERVG